MSAINALAIIVRAVCNDRIPDDLRGGINNAVLQARDAVGALQTRLAAAEKVCEAVEADLCIETRPATLAALAEWQVRKGSGEKPPGRGRRRAQATGRDIGR